MIKKSRRYLSFVRRLVLVFHGSVTGGDYVSDATRFAEEVGGVATFVEGVGPRPWEVEGVRVPIYVAYGRDYERALALSDVPLPPIIAWPGLNKLIADADLVALHGSNHPANQYYLKRLGKPYITLGDLNGEARCSGVVRPLVLFRGWTYSRFLKSLRGCVVREPLGLVPGFASLAKSLIDTFIRGVE